MAKSYEVYIHRRENWKEQYESPIEHADWLGCCRVDPTLTEDGEADSLGVHWYLPHSDGPPGLSPVFVWTGPDGIAARFQYFRGAGMGSSKSPMVVSKALELASKLNARVQGHEGEFYADGDAARVCAEKRGSWWRRVLGW